ncbi:ATP-grasp fold amidoligase family protein [Saccharicrinis sp. FJH65]|uniref:ATP-grasp fold amidoligase family protein n=1 Tax=Saccharicrinis sp. FJH65 TaxID=3344659 RepID=UPI0036D3540D
MNFGSFPDLKNPKTLNEKINWLKLNDRTPLHTICADKYKMRNYVRKKIGEEYLVPIVFTTKRIEDINESAIPDFPVIIKTNHDSGGGYIIKDKSKVNWKELHNILKKRLKINYYNKSNEWQYKNIERRIIVEKLLTNDKGGLPFDYKILCFNGKYNVAHVHIDRGTSNYKRNFYIKDWEKAPFLWPSVHDGHKIGFPTDYELPKPAQFERMIELSEILAAPFLCARIDWYIVEGKLYMGEITFHQDGGLCPIYPPEWDLMLGQKLDLHIKGNVFEFKQVSSEIEIGGL